MSNKALRQTVVVTGGAGFIGSNFIRLVRRNESIRLINLDKLTYAGNLLNLVDIPSDERYVFVQGDIGDSLFVRELFNKYQPTSVVNFAAESHVDRSISEPESFVQTNIVGTFRLLEETRNYWKQLGVDEKNNFRFLHVSTDEVYGSLKLDESPFKETNTYKPNSPYSASKASSDHFVRAYFQTYGLPVITTNCSNNYGPYQFPEKFIPLMILNALEWKSMPVYGDGQNIRDWLYVDDHCRAIQTVLAKGQPGETYNIGGRREITNLDLVHRICSALDNVSSMRNGNSYKSLIKFVPDRPGHDRRYAIDDSKVTNELGWKPMETFDTGLQKTIGWYMENKHWADSVRDGSYRDWILSNYSQRERKFK